MWWSLGCVCEVYYGLMASVSSVDLRHIVYLEGVREFQNAER